MPPNITTAFAAFGIAVLVMSVFSLGWRITHVAWIPFLEYRPGTFVFGAGKQDVKSRLLIAMKLAEDALLRHTKFTSSDLERAWTGIHIYVNDVELWDDSLLGTVYGMQIKDGIKVGSSLYALCHELAHMVCRVHLGDVTHAQWYALGVYNAIDEYTSKLHTTWPVYQ